MSQQQAWERRIGRQRQWIWRGWPIRYTFVPEEIPQDAETKPPLILIHGFGAGVEHWRHNIPTLRQYYRVYALDLLGFGRSHKAATDYTAYLWAEQIYYFWRSFIGKPVVLVGNSIGSLVCLTAAFKYPEMVSGLVMLSLPDVSLRQEAIPKGLRPIVNTIEGLFSPPLLLRTLFNIIRRPGVIRPWVGVAYHDKSAINTVEKSVANYQRAQVKEIKKVKTKTLNSIIKNSKFKDLTVDFVSIDVEGHELEVIKGLDLKKYKPKVVIIEFLDLSLKKLEIKNLNIKNFLKSEIYQYMIDKNYTLVNLIHSDLVFVNNSFRD